jgi:hypothetical protein
MPACSQPFRISADQDFSIWAFPLVAPWIRMPRALPISWSAMIPAQHCWKSR